MPCLYLIGDLHLDTLGNRGRVMHRGAGCLFKVLKTSGSNELEGFIDDLLASPSRGATS